MAARAEPGHDTRTLIMLALSDTEDRETWERLFAHIERDYLAPLSHQLRRWGLPISDVEDLLSEIRLRLFESRLSGYRPEDGEFRPWLFYSVARNHVRNRMRQLSRRRARTLPSEPSSVTGFASGSVEEDWEAACVAKAVLDSVVEVIKTLPHRNSRLRERVRNILVSVWVEGRDASETARKFRLRVHNVRHHLRKHRGRLLTSIEKSLRRMDLADGPFGRHCVELGNGTRGDGVDSIVRAAARYLLDVGSSPVTTTRALREHFESASVPRPLK